MVQNVEQLINITISEQPGFGFDRVRKFHTDFKEFVDVDRHIEAKNFDRFLIFLSRKEAPSQADPGEACQIQVFYFCPVLTDLDRFFARSIVPLQITFLFIYSMFQ